MPLSHHLLALSVKRKFIKKQMERAFLDFSLGFLTFIVPNKNNERKNYLQRLGNCQSISLS